MSQPQVVVISAGLSQPSSTRLLADQLAAATTRSLAENAAAEQRAQPNVEVVELRDHAHDLTNNLLTGVPTGNVRAAKDIVAAADGVIAATPIFNASYSALFKAFFDIVEPESLSGTPTLIAATGGTPRHSLALEHAIRPLFTYLRSVVVPTAVYAASEDWGAGGDTKRDLTERVERAASELADLIKQRPATGSPDPFETVTPFEQLLAN